MIMGRRVHDHMVVGLTTTCAFEPRSWQGVLN